MKLITEQNPFKSFPVRYIFYLIAAMFISVIDILALDLIQIGGITPDLLLVLVIYITLAESQFIGLFAGFAIGLFFDLVSANNLATNALAKTIAAYIAGFFFKPTSVKQNLQTFRFVLIVLLSSFVHNIIYYFFYIKSSPLDFWSFFLKFGVAASFYTAVISVFPVLVRIPGRQINID